MGRKIIQQDVSQQVSKMILQLPVFGSCRCTGSFRDQHRKISKRVLQNRIVGFEGLYQARLLRQKVRFTPKKLLDLFSVGSANKRRNTSQAGPRFLHLCELLDKGIV